MIKTTFNYSFIDLKKANLLENVNAGFSASSSSTLASLPYILDKSNTNTSKVSTGTVYPLTPRELISVDPRFSASHLWVKSDENLRLWWE